MRKATRISLALGTSAALLSLSALPASAAEGDIIPSAETPAPAPVTATVAVPSNGISISIKNAPDNVDYVFDGIGTAGSAEISVPKVTVTDLRAGVLGWGVSVDLANFADGTGKEISTAGAEYTVVNHKVVGTTAVPAWGESVSFEEPTDVGRPNRAEGAVTVASVTGNNEATWEAELSIPVPSTVLAGNYSATLTHSVL